MMYRLFKFILPALAIFSLLIWLSGNNSLYENFTMNFLTRLSRLELKNPAHDFLELLDIFDYVKEIQYNLTQPNSVTDFIKGLYMLGFSPSVIFVKAATGLCLVFYDVLYNIIQILRLIFVTTGVTTINVDSQNYIFNMVALI